MNQYASMLEAAQVSLQYNTEDKNEYQARVLAIKVFPSFLARNTQSNDKMLDWSKLKALANDKINLTEKMKFVLGKIY